jgi:hypothetical protein
VYLGAADPSPFAVAPANKELAARRAWRRRPSIQRAPRRCSMVSICSDRDHDGVREDRAGHPARFSVIVVSGLTEAQKGMEFVRDQLARVGIGLDIVTVDLGSMMGPVAEGRTTTPSTSTCFRPTPTRRRTWTGG